MSQQTFSIRMDSELKEELDQVCEEMGLNATTAFNIFARAVVRERRIPFDVKAQAKETKQPTQQELLALLASMKQ